VPGDAPEPIPLGEHTLRAGPCPAVLGEHHTRLAAAQRLALVHRAAGDDHEAVIRGDREFRVAQVNPLFGDQSDRSPGPAVSGCEDAELAGAADMGFGLAEGAVPFPPPTDQVGEGVVLALVPDFHHGNQLRS
jgi:hypothetical protein